MIGLLVSAHNSRSGRRRHTISGHDEQYVIGVDFGSLSGRAVVVRVRDGAELGSATHDYPHGVLDRRLPDGRHRSAPTGRSRCPPDYVDVLKHAVPGRGASCRHRTRRGSSGSAPTSPPARWCRPRATALRCASSHEFEHQPHAYVKLWKHHAAQPQADRINALAHERGEPWIARYGGLISSEWEFAKGLQMLEEARGLRRHRPLGGGGRLDRLAAVRTLPAQRLHRRLQGHLPGRSALRARDYPRWRSTPTSAIRGRQDRARDGRARRTRRLPHRRGRGLDRAARGHRRRRRQRRRTRDRPGGAVPSSPARWSPSWARPPATS